MRPNPKQVAALARAMGLARHRPVGGSRPGAGRKPQMLFGRSLGDLNQSAIVSMMIEFMAVGPFGQEPLAKLPQYKAPKVRYAACLTWKWMQDKSAFDAVCVEIVAGGARKVHALESLRRDAEEWRARGGGPSVPRFGIQLKARSWKTCLTYYKRHRRRKDLPLTFSF